MKRVLFQSNFYVKFKAPNSQDLINYIESIDQSLINNQMFDWGTLSSSDKIALKSQGRGMVSTEIPLKTCLDWLK